MSVDSKLDVKPFIKLALAEGKARQSSITGFVHYTFEDSSSRDAIPVFENILFVLALCRSNQADLVLEGRDLLMKLHEYFVKSSAFSVYLHEWPEIKKPLANVRLLFPLLHIWREYRHVFGDEARKKISEMLQGLSAYVDSLDMPPLLLFQKKVFNALFHNDELPRFDQSLCSSTKDWSEIIVVAPFLEEKIIFPYCDECHVFAGGYGHELKRATLFDLFFGHKAREDEISPLQCALIYDFPYETYLPSQMDLWKNVKTEGKLFSHLEKYSPQETRVSPGHHLFQVATKENALVCQNKDMYFTSEFNEGELSCAFSFGEKSDVDFFLRHFPGECLYVNGEKATFFECGDRLTIMGLEIVFTKISGSGRLCGHFLRGNRKGETCPKVKTDWAAYDWQINLTALEHEKDLIVCATIRSL